MKQKEEEKKKQQKMIEPWFLFHIWHQAAAHVVINYQLCWIQDTKASSDTQVLEHHQISQIVPW